MYFYEEKVYQCKLSVPLLIIRVYPSDFVTSENKASALSMGDGNITASQPSTGYQPAWVGGHGQKSMADIVKMGRPQSKVSSIPTPSQYSGKTSSQFSR